MADESQDPREPKQPEEPKKPDSTDKPEELKQPNGEGKPEPPRKVVWPKKKTATERLQDEIDRVTGPRRELERMQEQIDRLSGARATDQLQQEIDRVLGSSRELERMHEQVNKLAGGGAFEKLARDSFGPLKSELDRLQDVVLKANSLGSYVEQLRVQMADVDPYWLRLQKETGASLASHGIGSALEQMRNSGVMPDYIGKTATGFWLGQVKGPSPVSAQATAYEQLVGSLLGSVVAASAFDDVLHALRSPPQEVKDEVTSAAKDVTQGALAADTPDAAYRGFRERLRNLDPATQLILTLFIAPLFWSLFSAFLNPVAEHIVNGWRKDSPQGQVKQATERVVTEAGGTTVLADYRLVIAQPRLIVRESPAAAGKPIGALEFGTALRVLRKQDAHSLVEWRGEGETILTGWVFSRYLKPFK